ncbi:MAG: ABC transporter permease, partial [Rhizobiales bacterium]|nr:ABC transporter permease [Hyphomicrobiales bacterium]
MSLLLRCWQGAVALLLCLLALTQLPLLGPEAPLPVGSGATSVILLLIAGGALASFLPIPPAGLAALLFVAAHAGAWLLIGGIDGNEG